MDRTMFHRNGRPSTRGKFDDGYEAMRERIIKRQKELGWVPQADTN
jgi:hypothetical protein